MTNQWSTEENVILIDNSRDIPRLRASSKVAIQLAIATLKAPILAQASAVYRLAGPLKSGVVAI